LDENVPFSKLKKIAQQAEKKILKAVNLFDVYEGGKLAKGKKSYAISFTLADENKTLTDKYVDKVMEKLIKSFKEKVGAKIR
jgi:phenylalanyl-tRNA synthetase beta chain